MNPIDAHFNSSAKNQPTETRRTSDLAYSCLDYFQLNAVLPCHVTASSQSGALPPNPVSWNNGRPVRADFSFELTHGLCPSFYIHEFANRIVDATSIELRFDESGQVSPLLLLLINNSPLILGSSCSGLIIICRSYRSSLSRIPERYVCLWPGCEVTCKRVYELKRHVNRHKLRRCWFCPISGCRCKFASDFRQTWHLWSGSSVAWTIESIDKRSKLATLLGFPRLDKWQEHLQKKHSQVIIVGKRLRWSMRLHKRLGW